MHSPLITILICTLNDRIRNVSDVLLEEERADVRYLVSFQYTDDMFLSMLPPQLRRHDVEVLPFPATGLSANRNNALSHCATPLALISDDDVRYTTAHIDRIIQLFKTHPKMDIACFRQGKMAIRISQRIPFFDTRFGIGSAYLSCGEEEVLLHQAHRYGLNVNHYDEHICHNAAPIPQPATPWERFPYDKRVRRSWGALQYMLHSTPVAFVRIIIHAMTISLPKAQQSPFPTETTGHRRWLYLKDMLAGLKYIITHSLNESVAEEIPLNFQPINIWKLP